MESGDFFDNLAFGSIIDVESASESVEHELLWVVIGGEGIDWGGEVTDGFGLVALPKALLIGQFILGLRWFKGLKFLIRKLLHCWDYYLYFKLV